jgi:hypothetical protein
MDTCTAKMKVTTTIKPGFLVRLSRGLKRFVRTLKALITERKTKNAKKAVRKTGSDVLPFLVKY